MKILWNWIAGMRGKNLDSTPVDVIRDQLREPRPLPMGRQEFEAWSDRIISGAYLPPTTEDPEVYRRSQQFALANMIMHLGPLESHAPDGHFIHSLRKCIVNQVADAFRCEIRDEAKARLAKQEAEAKAQQEAHIKDAAQAAQEYLEKTNNAEAAKA